MFNARLTAIVSKGLHDKTGDFRIDHFILQHNVHFLLVGYPNDFINSRRTLGGIARREHEPAQTDIRTPTQAGGGRRSQPVVSEYLQLPPVAQEPFLPSGALARPERGFDADAREVVDAASRHIGLRRSKRARFGLAARAAVDHGGNRPGPRTNESRDVTDVIIHRLHYDPKIEVLRGRTFGL